MKRKILIPIPRHETVCADCKIVFTPDGVEWFRGEDLEPICFRCSQTCDFCDDFTHKVVVVRNEGHSRILCLECAQMSKEALQ